MNKYLTVTINM